MQNKKYRDVINRILTMFMKEVEKVRRAEFKHPTCSGNQEITC
jgi:hypothetical protein